MSETTALGVAMAAGAAEGVDVWSLSPDDLPDVTSEKYEPQINSEGKKNKTRTWKLESVFDPQTENTQFSSIKLELHRAQGSWHCSVICCHQVVGRSKVHLPLYDFLYVSVPNLVKVDSSTSAAILWTLLLWLFSANVCVFVSVTNRERVPLRSLEEGCPESHELGDHRAVLQL